jgi:outer membrane usher protein
MPSSVVFRHKKLTYLIAVILISMAYSRSGMTREYFNPALLEVDNPDMSGTDLSAFEDGAQAPGTYHVDIIINDRTVDTTDVAFKLVSKAGKDSLQPCLSVSQLQKYGVKTVLFPALNGQNGCADLKAIPAADSTFAFNAQQLHLSIPQMAMAPETRGYVDPESWDEGITAALLNYSFSGDKTTSRSSNGQNSQSQYGNIRPGINIGPWRLRNYSTWNRDTNGNSKWDMIYTYAERNIVSLKSNLLAGDSSTPSDVFDSIPFRGVQLATDDDMLPDSLKGYAPVVKGIARTSAQIVIRQNGYVIYQSYVSPGAFEITDMYPTGGSGDLFVTIKEADGSEQHFRVPYASVPVLQREGHLKYSLTGGQYRSYNSDVDKAYLVQGTAIYGLAHGITLYSGIQHADHYQSAAFGSGINMGRIGAISVDVTEAYSQPNLIASTRGRSWRIRYSKDFIETGTNFTIAGYRYSTDGYYDMQEVLESYGDENALSDRRRNRKELTVSQSLGDTLGSITGSLIKEDYWDSSKASTSYSLGYNNSFKGISWGIDYSYSKNVNDGSEDGENTYDNDKQIAFHMSVPLDKFLSNTWANYNFNASKNSNTTHSLGLSGTALDGGNLSWNVQQGYGTDNAGYSGSMDADYRGSKGEVMGGYSYDPDTSRVHYGLSGGAVIHSGGVTLSQPLGETVALVEARGAKDVQVVNQVGIHTDSRGYAIVSNVSPYRKNDISLDTSTLPDDAELKLSSNTVVPTRGAIVKAKYDTSGGIRALMTLTRDNGKPVPFGAMVTLSGASSKQSFIVGDAGVVYLSGLNPHELLVVQWGQDDEKSCTADFRLPENKNDTVAQPYILSGACHNAG